MKGMSLYWCCFMCFLLGNLLGSAPNKARAVPANVSVAKQQMLQMVINASRCHQADEVLHSNPAIYYPDDDLDTTVYSIQFSSEPLAIIAIAKDTNGVPEDQRRFGYYLASGLPVR